VPLPPLETITGPVGVLFDATLAGNLATFSPSFWRTALESIFIARGVVPIETTITTEPASQLVTSLIAFQSASDARLAYTELMSRTAASLSLALGAPIESVEPPHLTLLNPPPPSPSPTPPPPSPSPSPPLPDGTPTDTVDIAFIFTVAGDVADLDRVIVIASLYSILLVQGINPVDVKLTVEPASVRLTALISVEPDEVELAIAALKSRSPQSLSVALNVMVESVDAVGVAAPPPPVVRLVNDQTAGVGKTTTAGQTAAGGGDGASPALIATVVVVVVLVFVVAAYMYMRLRRRPPKAGVVTAVGIHTVSAGESTTAEHTTPDPFPLRPGAAGPSTAPVSPSGEENLPQGKGPVMKAETPTTAIGSEVLHSQQVWLQDKVSEETDVQRVLFATSSKQDSPSSN